MRVSASMFSRWISLKGVSRGSSTSLRRSLSMTSAARSSRLPDMPVRMLANVFMLHGATTMPSVRKEPLAMHAARLAGACTTPASAATSRTA